MNPRQIFEADVRGIDWADVVVANMDGADPDSGTCWECGYAYRKKPIVIFRTDFRVGYENRIGSNVEATRIDCDGLDLCRGDEGDRPGGLRPSAWRL
jgi:nucleoside 2-deoxyribosyltransferase